MNTVINNLNILANLSNNDYLDTDGHKLKILDKDNNEYENIHSPSIINLIINTLLLALKIKYSNIFKYKLLLEKISLVIDNLYENKLICEIINNDQYFQEILELCDNNNEKLYENAVRNKCNFYSSILSYNFDRFLNNTIIICKQIHHVQLSILNADGGISSDEGEESGGEESGEEVSGEEVSGEEESGEDKKKNN